jgi:hypothetical protein
MSHTKEQIAKWIRDQWAADYFRFDDVQADFKVLSFVRQDESLQVTLSFIADESKKGNDSESLVMFRYDPENYQGFFPKYLQIVTLDETYTFENSEDCDALAEPTCENTGVIDVEYVDWDDPKLTDEVVAELLSRNDEYAIAETLINLHNAKIKMPDFVPARLKPYFEQMIKEFE